MSNTSELLTLLASTCETEPEEVEIIENVGDEGDNKFKIPGFVKLIILIVFVGSALFIYLWTQNKKKAKAAFIKGSKSSVGV